MKNQFSIGQMVVMQHGTFHTEHEGQLAVITGALAVRRALNASTMTEKNILCYEVRVLCTPPRTLLAEQYQLRPLDDPRAEHTADKAQGDSSRRLARRYFKLDGDGGAARLGRELTPDEVRVFEAEIERKMENIPGRHSDGKS